MANAKYNGFKAAIQNGGIDLDTDDIKLALVTSTYTPDIDAHTVFSDITNEVTGTGYTAGGQSLTSKVISTDLTNDLAKFDAADVTWAASTITARGAVLYKNTGVAGTSTLIAYFDFLTDQVSSNGDFTVQWNANGILTIS